MAVGNSYSTPRGGETRVNATTAGSQLAPAVTTLTDGTYVVVWQSNGQDGDLGGIFGQRYSALGVPIGSEFAINSLTDGDQTNPQVTALSGGGFVVVWSSFESIGFDWAIKGQKYAANGTVAGSEFVIETYQTFEQNMPVVTALADDGFVVAYESYGADGSYDGVVAQRFDASGSLGTETLVNTTSLNDQETPAITTLGSGDYVVAWVSDEQDSSFRGVFMRRFSADGVAQTAEVQVNVTTLASQYDPAITALKDGGFVVSWTSLGQDGDGGGIYARVYDATGATRLTELRVNSTTAWTQDEPTVTALADGGFVIVWTTYNQIAGGDIFAKRFDRMGVALGGEFQVNTTTTGNQGAPTVSALPHGGFVISWQSMDQDGDYGGIYSQRFSPQWWGSGAVDELIGSRFSEIMWGRGSSDRLFGMDGNDTLMGESGNDLLYGALGNDVLDGGDGIDTAVLNTGARITVDLALTGAQDTGEGNDTLINIENVTTTSAADVIKGDDAANKIIGNGGNDQIWGRGGNDSLLGGTGNDTISGGLGDDTVNGGTGTDTAVFDSGVALKVDLRLTAAQDTGEGLDLLIDIENLTGGKGKDDLRGTDAANTIIASVGNDSVWARGGNDYLRGGWGHDRLDGGTGEDRLRGEQGTDTLIGGLGADVFIFQSGDGADVIRDWEDGIDLIEIRLNGGAEPVIGLNVDGTSTFLQFDTVSVEILNAGPGVIDASDYYFVA